MKYRIKIIETLSKVVEVEADDYDSAFEKVEEMVNCEEVVPVSYTHLTLPTT